MIRVIYLTPAEVRACLADKAAEQIRNRHEIGGYVNAYAEKIDVVQTADGFAAYVTFADKDAPAPASMPPMGFRAPDPNRPDCTCSVIEVSDRGEEIHKRGCRFA